MKNFIEPLEVDFEVVNRSLTQEEQLAVSNHIAATKARTLQKTVAAKPLPEDSSNRILELLHQIDCVNEMIRFHQDVTQEDALVNEYQHQKIRFVQSLQEVLSRFEVGIELEPLALQF